MRIDILAIGSEGDVRPNVALGLGLKKAGHRVRIVTLGGFEEIVRGNGLDYLSIAASPRDIGSTAAGRQWIGNRASSRGFLFGFIRVAGLLIESSLARYWPACTGVEALIVTPMGQLVGMHVAERLQVPLVRAGFSPTRHDWADRKDLATALRGHFDVFVFAVFRLLLWMSLRRLTNASRQNTLGLPPLPLRDPSSALERQRVPVFDAYSPTVVPKPRHWDSWTHVTGYWFLDEDPEWVPPPELADFLESGPPPVFVGFGSTPFPQPEAATDLVVQALTSAGQRGVVLAGGSGLATGRLTDEILSIDAAPHGWLFRRVCAAVHHGGAGVTGAALRAGLPSIVVPVFGDQPFWGKRVFELGAGPRPIPAKQLSMELLASAIRRTAGNDDIRQRAACIARQIGAEDGVARAVEAFHEYVG